MECNQVLDVNASLKENLIQDGNSVFITLHVFSISLCFYDLKISLYFTLDFFVQRVRRVAFLSIAVLQGDCS